MAYKKIEKPEVNTEVEETTGETVATAAAEACIRADCWARNSRSCVKI